MLHTKPLIVGNWKMHGNLHQNQQLLNGLLQCCCSQDVIWVVCPPTPYLSQAHELLAGSQIAVGAQSVSYFDQQGAYTGEVSSSMLTDFDVKYVITGHSERRTLLHETDDTIYKSLVNTISQGMTAILCIGESKHERDSGDAEKKLSSQLSLLLQNITPEIARQVVIAYEPIWAIGTGTAASTDDIKRAHQYIRNCVKEKDAESAESVRILYGGSVNPSNAADVLAIDGVDGVLVGGKSLDPKAFSEIGLCKLY